MEHTVKSIITIAAILFVGNIIAAQENTTHLTCTLDVSQWTKRTKQFVHSSSREEVDIKVKEGEDYIEFSTDSSTAGASIFFSTKAHFFLKFANINNFSDESKWDYSYNIMDRDGELFSKNSFTINRYTGSIKIEYRTPGVHAESRGKCIRSSAKRF